MTKILDSAYLTRAYTTSQQMKSKIAEIILANESSLEELPHSMVPSELLFNIVVAYIDVYNKLLEHDLVSTGNHKEHKTIQ